MDSKSRVNPLIWFWRTIEYGLRHETWVKNASFGASLKSMRLVGPLTGTVMLRGFYSGFKETKQTIQKKYSLYFQ